MLRGRWSVALSPAPPRCDLDRERAVIDTVLEAIRARVVTSAHDCADGGLAVALAECMMADRAEPFGATVDLSPWNALPLRAVLFGEAQGRVIISTAEPDRVLAVAASHGVPARRIGTVTPAADGLTVTGGDRTLRADVASLAAAYHDTLPGIMTGSPQAIMAEETDGVVP